MTFLATQNLAIGNIEVPEKVTKSFQKKYPVHSEASWDDLGDVFVVTFYDKDDILREATFDLEGVWKETITIYDEEDMPQVIAGFIKKKYGENVEVYEVAFSEKPEGAFYFVGIGIEGDSDDEEEMESESYTLTFDAKGKFLKLE